MFELYLCIAPKYDQSHWHTIIAGILTKYIIYCREGLLSIEGKFLNTRSLMVVEESFYQPNLFYQINYSCI